MNEIMDFIYDLLPADRKQRGNGWTYFNCPMCKYTEMPDSKHRGNILLFDDGFVYQCFNCKFKCGFRIGQYLSKKCYSFLKEFATDKQMRELLEMIKKYNESHNPEEHNKETIVKREIRDIPKDYKSIRESLVSGETDKHFQIAKCYIEERNPRLFNWANLMWSKKTYGFLIPCYEYGKVVGYSIRKADDEVKNKYIHYVPQGYIFNFDNLLLPREYEIITEGQLDALAINGISILSNEFTQDRLKRILPYVDNKEIILMPDRDKAGRKMVDQLLEEELPFSVAFPNWERGIKDCFDAVKKYGRLYTIYSIITSKESDKDLIKIKAMKWFS